MLDSDWLEDVPYAAEKQAYSFLLNYQFQ